MQNFFQVSSPLRILVIAMAAGFTKSSPIVCGFLLWVIWNKASNEARVIVSKDSTAHFDGFSSLQK